MRHVSLLLLLFLLLATAHGRGGHGSTVMLTRRRIAVPREADPDGMCYDDKLGKDVPFGHAEMWACASKIGDVNPKDGHITGDEMDAVMHKYMNWAERAAVSAASGDTHHHLRDCSGSFFGSITQQSMLRYKNTCVPLQNDRCMLKTLCDRAAKALGKEGQIY